MYKTTRLLTSTCLFEFKVSARILLLFVNFETCFFWGSFVQFSQRRSEKESYDFKTVVMLVPDHIRSFYLIYKESC